MHPRNLRFTTVPSFWFLVPGLANSEFWSLVSGFWIIRFLNLRNLRLHRVWLRPPGPRYALRGSMSGLGETPFLDAGASGCYTLPAGQ